MTKENDNLKLKIKEQDEWTVWYRKGHLDFQKRYHKGLEDYQRLEGMYHDTRKEKGTLELLLQKKLEYIEFLEYQQSEFGDTLVQTKRKVEEYEHSERLLKSRIDDLTSENTNFWNFLEEHEHSERLLKSRIEALSALNTDLQYHLDKTKRKVEEYEHSERLLKSIIDDLTSENTNFQSMIEVEKSQNEKLANDLKESQTELGEPCAKSEAL